MSKHSSYLQAISQDDSLPIESAAVKLWLQDLDNGFRWVLRPILQLFFSVLLHIVWFIKRLPFPQFSAHDFLQKTICWFCKIFVSPEANLLILRHFATESNILNFLSENSGHQHRVNLYPKTINDMLKSTFVNHDQELFDCFIKLGSCQDLNSQPLQTIKKWDSWQPIDMSEFSIDKKCTQILDFETSHALFMCLFCLLLKKDEYRDAINGFNLDQSIAIRIGKIIGEPCLTEYAYNKYPQYLVGPWNLGQRFLMHGFFTEHLYARLEEIRKSEIKNEHQA
ncbi:DUF6999 family protein [Colwellia psychrerythraea]|uniref:Uncharacterized protein n=1 Tax=Colwellia psychrerythraea TaxID=28229 RepID=A0A099L3V7_COLPS|nr:hypothetical protein [Colwellia psychrerythraea]KGJ97551.1 hypothetical protein GAB14E_1140 [Colwellia psychrerythraea]